MRDGVPADDRRVLVVIRWPVGGQKTYLRYNYPALLRAGYRFTFVGPGDDWFREMAKEFKSWDGSEFIEAPVHGNSCKLRPTVRHALRHNRFALMHSNGLTAGVHAVLANIGIGVPHVMTLHDVIRADQFPGVFGRVKRRALAEVLRRATALIAVGDDCRENHLEYFPASGRGPCRIVTIHNGIDVERFSEQSPSSIEPLRRRLNLGEDVFLMGFLGRFMPQKGFLVLIDALNWLLENGIEKECHLVAVGSDDCLGRYRREVNRRPRLSGRVSFVAHVPDAAPIIRELDLMVMPSLWEAYGLLAAEALVLGIPVVGSNCIGLREVLQGTPSLTPPAGDAIALAGALLKAINSPWNAEARAYQPLARQRFDVAESALRLRRLFDECLC